MTTAGSASRTVVDGLGPAPARPGRPRDMDLDDRILDATLDLLIERGYEHMTMDDVAQRARVAKATVYRRYISKEELAVDSVKRIFDAKIATPDTGSFRGDLEAIYRSTLEFGTRTDGPAVIRLAVTESCREPRVAAMYAEWLRGRELNTAEIFDRAVNRGEIRTDWPREAVYRWLPSVIVLRAVLGDDPLDPALAADLVGVTMRGVQA